MEVAMSKLAPVVPARIIPVALSLCFAFLTGCGDDGTEITNITNKTVGMEKAASLADLPECSADNFGLIFFVADSAKVVYCNGKNWATMNGADGKDGKDGKDGEDGEDGVDGKDGINGKDGISAAYDSLTNQNMGDIDTSLVPVVIVNYGHTVEGLGECTNKKDGVVSSKDSSYFTCKNGNWQTAIPQEYDTYQWADSSDGATKKGDVTGALYIYDYNQWRIAVGVEKELGACVKINEYEVKKFKDTYYICKQRIWNTALTVEYDTYGKSCLKDASIITGAVNSQNKYVCDGGEFRLAHPIEVSGNLGCTSYNNGSSWKIENSNYICDKYRKDFFVVDGDTLWTHTDRDTSGWSYDFYHLNTGTFTDGRDGNTYKTVGIKSQVWMAQNLRYVSAQSKCRDKEIGRADTTECLKYGRLYNWNDAKNVCPEGWRLPDSTDWLVLWYATSGGPSEYNESEDNVGYYRTFGRTDYGFSALRTFQGSKECYYKYTYEADQTTIKDSVQECMTNFHPHGNESDRSLYYWTSTEGTMTYTHGNGETETIPAAGAKNLHYQAIEMYDRVYDYLAVRCIKNTGAE